MPHADGPSLGVFAAFLLKKISEKCPVGAELGVVMVAHGRTAF